MSRLSLYRWARRRGPLRWFRPTETLSRAFDVLRFLDHWRQYQQLPGAEPLALVESWPCLGDNRGVTPFDPHYFYQAAWACRHIAASQVARHVDVGSDHRMAGMLTAVTHVIFTDFRPLQARMERLSSVAADLLALPYADASLQSVSCLHVVEHVGLGRYGDPLRPSGTRDAVAELGRVLAAGGTLLLSCPIGRPRVQFNGQRVHTASQVLGYASALRLIDFAVVDDAGRFVERGAPDGYDTAEYACGLFLLEKPT